MASLINFMMIFKKFEICNIANRKTNTQVCCLCSRTNLVTWVGIIYDHTVQNTMETCFRHLYSN